MADSSTKTITIDAPSQRVAEVICDFAGYPGWVSAVTGTEVLEWYEDGYPARVRFTVDAGVFTDEYELVYEYAEDISRIEWHLAGPSRAQRDQRGSYDLVDNGAGGTTVTYTLSVDLSIPLPGFLRKRAEKSIMDSALVDLKRQVERGPAG